MRKALLIICFINALSLIDCKNKKDNKALLFGAIAVSKNQSQKVINETYTNGSNFTLLIGSIVTLSPANHTDGSTYSITPSLPSGLGFNTSTGVISGSPSINISPTVFTITQTKPDGSKVIYTIIIGVSGSGTGNSNETTTAAPSFNPAEGLITSLQSISITTLTSGATIYYTTDGTSPTANSNIYTAPLANVWSLSGKTIQAFASKTGLTSSSVASAVFSYPTLKTGQTTVYSTGDNGSNQTGVARNYSDNSNGTITDNASGLVWQKCSRGQNNDSTCSGAATTVDWSNAGSYCSALSLASKTWRLPARFELETLPDYSKATSPAIDTSVFPNTVAGYYWSSTVYAPISTNAIMVYFSTGNTGSNNKTTSYYVRCVSGP
ncbi:MAG TPA: DUF1566 domain-containing protein [Leptospiraceae bacterium]|nr:DUF1566 domain-containing protein [Leptospiraceae bacterium]HMY66306.1 DUF1566 domain-containing protein [Leptospiraceae bacterium]